MDILVCRVQQESDSIFETGDRYKMNADMSSSCPSLTAKTFVRKSLYVFDFYVRDSALTPSYILESFLFSTFYFIYICVNVSLYVYITYKCVMEPMEERKRH